MNENIYKNLLEELNAGRKAIVITSLNSKEFEYKALAKKFLLQKKI